jgi:hypothetical protein
LWFLIAQRLRTRRLRNNNKRRTMTQKTEPTKNTLPSDTEDEKLYRDADEVESFGAESPILAGRLQALLEHLGITTAPRIGSMKSRVQGGWSSRPSQRFSSDPGSSADTRDQPSRLRTTMPLPMSPGRPSHHGSVATRAGCRARSTISYHTGRRINSSPTG